MVRRLRRYGEVLARYREILEYFCKSEIVPCMYNWDSLLENIDSIDTRGCKLYSINKEYNNFADFFLKESKGMSKSFIDNVTYKLHIDAHISKNFYSRLTKSYSYMMMRSMKMSSLTEWDINIKNLKRTRLVNDREVVTSSGLLKYFKSMDEVHRYCLNNHRIVKIERLKSKNVPVYCFTVPKYHNFFLACGILSANSQMELRTMAGASKCESMIEAFRSGADIHLQNAAKIFRKSPEEVKPEERRYSKMASFLILYGGDYHTFGNQFLGGDIALAKSIYDSFYSAYPEVADFIKAKHQEAKDHEKVTTLMDMFVSLEANDPQFHGDENARMRFAQNVVIQSASSMLAGCCLYEIMKYIQNNNMKSKVILFVHDSIEVDIHPDEMLELGTKIIPLMNQFPNEKFNLPVKADLVLGKSIGQEVEIQSIECNDDYTEGWLECESTEEHFDALIDTWKSVYPVVEYEDIDEPKVKYKSWSDLWIPKLAIQKGYGEDYRIVHRKVHIKTKM